MLEEFLIPLDGFTKRQVSFKHLVKFVDTTHVHIVIQNDFWFGNRLICGFVNFPSDNY